MSDAVENYIQVDDKYNGNGTMTTTIRITVPIGEEAAKVLPKKLRGKAARDRFFRDCQAYIAARGAAVELAKV